MNEESARGHVKAEKVVVLTSASRVTSMFLGGEVDTAEELRAMAARSIPAHDAEQLKPGQQLYPTHIGWSDEKTYCRS